MSLFRKFLAAKRGNVAVTFAMSLVPLIAMIGLGVDVAFNLNAKTVLDGAADAAALAAATTAQAQLAKGATQAQANTAAVAAGQAMFASNTVKIAASIGKATPTVSVQFDTVGLKVNSAVGYQAQIKTVFGQMFGVKTMNLSRSAAAGDSATASMGMAKFMQVTFAVDNSGSMGIGASQSDIDKLSALTGCAFGCHYGNAGGPSNEDIAHMNGVKLRIDVVKDAVKKIIGSAEAGQAAYTPKREAFSIYTLAAEAMSNPTLAFLHPLTAAPSTDYSSLLSLANGIDLVGFGFTGGETSMGAGLQMLAPIVGTSGNGMTAQTPVKYVFILTDGLEDLFIPESDFPCRAMRSGIQCTAPLDPSRCEAFKRNGVTVAVIYTTYLPVEGYNEVARPFASEFVPNLKACASGPQWFAEATDASAIDAALTTFYGQAQASAVLTQ